MVDLKESSRAAIDDRLGGLVSLSHTIHEHPETAYEEDRAAAWTSKLLADNGFAVTEGVAGLPTAFDARFGSGPMVVAVCAEYDALPGIGHACGHNIIAASAVGAGLGLAAVADQLGITVRVVGTPAEEGGGGKVVMLDEGVFDGVHAAMMVHPWPSDRLEATCLAVAHFDVIFTGKGAHASAAPWEGINAGDAMVIAQVALGLLRQQLQPGDQVHGVVLDGGSAANIIPDRVTGRFMCRSLTLEGLGKLEPRVRACFEAGASASGATVAYERLSPDYSHMESDPGLLSAYRVNAERLGRTFDLDDDGTPRPTLSTDMANVSLAVPTIHPMIGIDAAGSVNHQPEFAAACVTPSADTAIRDGALSMAWTVIDAAGAGPLRDRLLAG
ncbi:MAG TPA: M20 family metallopeptidase [Acidimicrobiales bacterium]|jgi:amidohydrolase|nr:M20 family metallopeptidase [Acidimicrobiales bacterium]